MLTPAEQRIFAARELDRLAEDASSGDAAQWRRLALRLVLGPAAETAAEPPSIFEVLSQGGPGYEH